MKRLLLAGVLLFVARLAYAQCAVTAPPLAGIRVMQTTVRFFYFADGGLLTDGGACLGTATGVTGLPDDPNPKAYPVTRGVLCPNLQAFGQQALVTDVGRGDGGAP